MAEPEHLRALAQGVGSWNAARDSLPLTDLSTASICAAFMDADTLDDDRRIPSLAGADLTYTNLNGTVFYNIPEPRGVDLARADFGHSNLRNAVLKEAILDDAVFTPERCPTPECRPSGRGPPQRRPCRGGSRQRDTRRGEPVGHRTLARKTVRYFPRRVRPTRRTLPGTDRVRSRKHDQTLFRPRYRRSRRHQSRVLPRRV